MKESVKVYAGFAASVALAAVLMFLIVAVHNRMSFPAEFAAHQRLQEAIYGACALPAEEFNAIAAKVVRSNEAVWGRHVRQRDSWLGDLLLTDDWENVRYVVIPTEIECAQLTASPRS